MAAEQVVLAGDDLSGPWQRGLCTAVRECLDAGPRRSGSGWPRSGS
jgi:hypothetical protein